MRKAVSPIAVAALTAGLLAAVDAVRAQHPRKTAIVEVVEKTRDAVVALRVTRSAEWGGSRSGVTGTGIIIDERGYLVTNHHVIADAVKITATLSDKTTVEARIHTEDHKHDLAILRLPLTRKFKALQFGPGSDLMVGETVIAIGNPFGYMSTVSTGIISALGREVTMPSGTTLANLIQTNASINPGNSGGPLLNVNGELIGINVALRHDAQNIAFALNAETVKEALSKHLSAIKVSKVGHGLVCAEKVVPERTPRQRVVVEKVSGAGCSIQRGDVLVKIGCLTVQNRFDVERALWGYKAGDKVAVTVLRAGRPTSMALTLESGTRAATASLRPR